MVVITATKIPSVDGEDSHNTIRNHLSKHFGIKWSSKPPAESNPEDAQHYVRSTSTLKDHRQAFGMKSHLVSNGWEHSPTEDSDGYKKGKHLISFYKEGKKEGTTHEISLMSANRSDPKPTF